MITKNYRKELPELKGVPNDNIYAIYIIPYEPYDGFWGKNEYMNYDFVFCGRKGELGWVHWEGDVINLFNDTCEVNLSIDCPVECGYLRIYSMHKLEIDKLFISSTTIRATREEKGND